MSEVGTRVRLFLISGSIVVDETYEEVRYQMGELVGAPPMRFPRPFFEFHRDTVPFLVNASAIERIDPS